jgi:membrane-associated protein
MGFLEGVQGSVAAILICTLLFVDEAGLPIPIAPSEVLLLLTGVLIASDAFSIWVIVPIETVVMAAGMIAGYSWARVLGQSGLRALAERFGAQKAYDRVQARVQSSGPIGIAVCRLLPGLRPYATLMSGAAEVPVRTYLLGALPALLLWQAVFVLVGILVGLPAWYFLGRFEKLALRGGVLIALAAIAWLGIRRIPDDWDTSIGPQLRRPLALAVDAGILGSVVVGVLAIGRLIVHVASEDWIELLAIALIVGLAMIFARGDGLTPGEALFKLRYWSTRPAS